MKYYCPDCPLDMESLEKLISGSNHISKKEHIYRVHVSGGQSTIRTLRSGVPESSILGPMLFSLYIAPIGDLLRSLDIDFHLYADDTQLYVTFKCFLLVTVQVHLCLLYMFVMTSLTSQPRLKTLRL